MMYHSFLAGLSVGRTLKGWAGGGTKLSLAPTCRLDSGVSAYFYIDYHYGLQNVSYGRVRNTTAIFGASGEIIPREVEAVDSHTVKVWADLAGQVKVTVYGNAKPGLTYFDGSAVGAYAAELYPAGAAPYELPYLADSAKAPPVSFGAEERVVLHTEGTARRAAAETAAYAPTVLGGAHTLQLSYT